MSVLRAIIRGCRYVDGYGNHPGTEMLWGLCLLGAFAGAGRAGWRGAAFGFGVSLAVYGPLYLYGAYERGKSQANDRTTTEDPA